MSSDIDGVAVEAAEAHKVFEIEFGVAAVAENAATEYEHGIDLSACHEFGGEVNAFHVGGLTV